MKHASRKIMHGVLDLLPILIIGVFAIYSHRHEPTQSITYAQNELLDFNQQLNKDNFPTSTLVNGIGFQNLEDGLIIASGTSTGSFSEFQLYTNSSPINLKINHKYYLRGCAIGGANNTYFLRLRSTNNSQQPTDYSTGSVFTAEFSNYSLFIRIMGEQSVSNLGFIPQLYDLTQIYGAGNEPLITEFKEDFPLQYYPYTQSEKILNKNVSEITYNDTDIGSQMVYALYNPIDKYFNLNKVANFEQVYDFFQVQFFNGNAPISIFIVWNIILYQFIMDIIFLVYMVFMFIIDFIGGMLDFMFRKSFGGAK